MCAEQWTKYSFILWHILLLHQLRCQSRLVMAWRWQRRSWRLFFTRLRKESGAPTHETKTARESSAASISFLHWVRHHKVVYYRNKIQPTPPPCLISLLFVHRGSQGIHVTSKSAGLPSVLHCCRLPHWPQHHPQTAGEPLLQVEQHA